MAYPYHSRLRLINKIPPVQRAGSIFDMRRCFDRKTKRRWARAFEKYDLKCGYVLKNTNQTSDSASVVIRTLIIKSMRIDGPGSDWRASVLSR